MWIRIRNRIQVNSRFVICIEVYSRIRDHLPITCSIFSSMYTSPTTYANTTYSSSNGNINEA